MLMNRPEAHIQAQILQLFPEFCSTATHSKDHTPLSMAHLWNVLDKNGQTLRDADLQLPRVVVPWPTGVTETYFPRFLDGPV